MFSGLFEKCGSGWKDVAQHPFGNKQGGQFLVENTSGFADIKY